MGTVVGTVEVGNSGEKADVGNTVGEADVGNAGEVCVVEGFSSTVGGLLAIREVESEDTST